MSRHRSGIPTIVARGYYPSEHVEAGSCAPKKAADDEVLCSPNALPLRAEIRF